MIPDPQTNRITRARSQTKTKDTLNTNFQPTETQKELDVMIHLLPKEEKELIQNLQVKLNENGDIDLCHVIDRLKQNGFHVSRSMIYYYSPSSDLYVFCGNDPVPKGTAIPKKEILQSNGRSQITLKIRLSPQLKKSSERESSKTRKSKQMEIPDNANSHTTRIKERNIGEILDKVLTWRKYYNGYTDPKTGELIKMSLDEVAEKVGVPKKSLDDYLMQVRCAKKFGFNFNDHYNDRMGLLRAFVKKYKNKPSVETKTPIENARVEDMQLEIPRMIEKKTPTKVQELIKQEDGEVEDSPMRESNLPLGLSMRSKKIHARR